MAELNDNEKGGANGVMDGDLEKRKIRGERLRVLRTRAGFTQVQLGELIGAKSPSTTISLLEGGKQSMSFEQVEQLAKVLGVNPIVLSTGNNYSDSDLEFLDQCVSVLHDYDQSTRAVISTILKARKAQ